MPSGTGSSSARPPGRGARPRRQWRRSGSCPEPSPTRRGARGTRVPRRRRRGPTRRSATSIAIVTALDRGRLVTAPPLAASSGCIPSGPAGSPSPGRPPSGCGGDDGDGSSGGGGHSWSLRVASARNCRNLGARCRPVDRGAPTSARRARGATCRPQAGSGVGRPRSLVPPAPPWCRWVQARTAP
jgi:hypothetical protein